MAPSSSPRPPGGHHDPERPGHAPAAGRVPVLDLRRARALVHGPGDHEQLRRPDRGGAGLTGFTIILEHAALADAGDVHPRARSTTLGTYPSIALPAVTSCIEREER